MIRTTFLTTLCAGALAFGPTASALPFGVGYALGDGGSTLVRLGPIASPSLGRSTPITSGGASLSLSALDYRPATGQFYGFVNDGGAGDDTVYEIDPATGAATSVATLPIDEGIGDGAAIGLDFNNVLDAARIVSTAGDNRVFFPNNTPPSVTDDPDGDGTPNVLALRYNDGDPNEGENPSIFANAYTNAVPGPDSTLQYVLDSDLNALATLDNNAGTLNTIGTLVDGDGAEIDFSAIGGFDIFSAQEGDNTAYALLNTDEGVNQLYTFALGMPGDTPMTVSATLVAALGEDFGQLSGLTTAPVPLPAGAWLLLSGLAGLGLWRRRAAA
ncbi:MAG: DUF4394 domain-containing protein [Paracoccaceae bacterium]